MENIMQTKKIKIVMIVMILMTMLCSYLPAIVHANITGQEEDYVKISEFRLTQFESNSVTSGSEIDITYRFQFTGVQTGFQNVCLKISNIDDENNPTPDATIWCDNDDNPRFIVYKQLWKIYRSKFC